MNKARAVLYALLIVLLPIAIISLSGNAVLRVYATYGYHFNDIQGSNLVSSNLSNSDLGKEIADYFNSFGDENFQIYEQNGEFSDPMFDDSEIAVMAKVKVLLKWTLIGGSFAFLLVVVIYVYLRLWGDKKKLRIVGYSAAGVTLVAFIAKVFLLFDQGFRNGLYAKYIGIPLNDESSLKILLQSPMEKTYLLFSGIVAMAIVVLFIYINSEVTKERGFFKRK